MAATVALDMKSLACSIFVLSFWQLYSWIFFKEHSSPRFPLIVSFSHTFSVTYHWFWGNYSYFHLGKLFKMVSQCFSLLHLPSIRLGGVISPNLSFRVWLFLIFWQPIYHYQRYFCCPSIPLWGYRNLLYQKAHQVVLLSLLIQNVVAKATGNLFLKLAVCFISAKMYIDLANLQGIPNWTRGVDCSRFTAHV